MNYDVGNLVVCKTEIRPCGNKYILNRVPNIKSTLDLGEFRILSIDLTMQTYMLLIMDDMIGWIVDEFHILHNNIPKILFGKKFYYITEDLILDDESEVLNKRKNRIKTELVKK